MIQLSWTGLRKYLENLIDLIYLQWTKIMKTNSFCMCVLSYSKCYCDIFTKEMPSTQTVKKVALKY